MTKYKGIDISSFDEPASKLQEKILEIVRISDKSDFVVDTVYIKGNYVLERLRGIPAFVEDNKMGCGHLYGLYIFLEG